jgi:hypothetical protein
VIDKTLLHQSIFLVRVKDRPPIIEYRHAPTPHPLWMRRLYELSLVVLLLLCAVALVGFYVLSHLPLSTLHDGRTGVPAP